MEIQQRFRYQYFRRKHGWRVAAHAVELPDGWLEFISYDRRDKGKTRQWRKQILVPVKGWTTLDSSVYVGALQPERTH